MLKYTAIMIIFIQLSLFSQEVIWENQVQMQEVIGISKPLIIDDNSGGYIVITDDSDRNIDGGFQNLYYQRYDSEGKMLWKKVYTDFDNQITPIDAYFIDDNTIRFFCGLYFNPTKINNRYFLPHFIDINLDGDVISEHTPYEINEENMENHVIVFTRRGGALKRVLIDENRNLIIMRNHDRTSEGRLTPFTQIKRFNADGINEWSIGIDTIWSDDVYMAHEYNRTYIGLIDNGESFYLADMITISDSDNDSIRYKVSQIYLAEISYDGEVLNEKKIDIANKNLIYHTFFRKNNDVLCLQGSEYTLAPKPQAHYYEFSKNLEPSNYNIVDLNRNIANDLRVLSNGDLLYYGNFYENDINRKEIITRMNKDYEIIYDYSWYEGEGICNIHNLFVNPDNTFTVVGNSNASNVYIAKIADHTSTVNDYESNLFFSIQPNPAGDYIEISFSSHRDSKGACPLVSSEEIAIYDVLGERVAHSSTSVPINRDTSASGGQVRIDISHLPKGVCFVRIGERVEKFVKK